MVLLPTSSGTASAPRSSLATATAVAAEAY